MAPNLSSVVKLIVVKQILGTKIIWVKFPGSSLPHSGPRLMEMFILHIFSPGRD